MIITPALVADVRYRLLARQSEPFDQYGTDAHWLTVAALVIEQRHGGGPVGWLLVRGLRRMARRLVEADK